MSPKSLAIIGLQQALAELKQAQKRPHLQFRQFIEAMNMKLSVTKLILLFLVSSCASWPDQSTPIYPSWPSDPAPAPVFPPSETPQRQSPPDKAEWPVNPGVIFVGGVVVGGVAVAASSGTFVTLAFKGVSMAAIGGSAAQATGGIMTYNQLIALPEVGPAIASLKNKPSHGWLIYEFVAGQDPPFNHFLVLDYEKRLAPLGAGNWKVAYVDPDSPGEVIYRHFRGPADSMQREIQMLETLRGGDSNAPVLKIVKKGGEFVARRYSTAFAPFRLAVTEWPAWTQDTRLIPHLLKMEKICAQWEIMDAQLLYDAATGEMVLADPFELARAPVNIDENAMLKIVKFWLNKLGVQSA